MPRGLELLKGLIERAIKSNTFDQCMKCLRLVSANNGQCVAEFTVDQEHLNLGGTLHGGFTSTIVDSVSTFALMTQGNAAPGVSVDLHITFLKAAFPGDVVAINARTIRAGRTLAFLEVELTKQDGVVVARGQHTKFIGT